MLQAQERAEHIGLEGSQVTVSRLLRHGAGLSFGTRVVDGYVQPTEARDGLIDQAANIVLVAHVGLHVFSLRAKRTQLFGQSLARLVAAAGDNDAGTFMSERTGCGMSDACEGTRNQNNGGIHEASRWQWVVRQTDACSYHLR